MTNYNKFGNNKNKTVAEKEAEVADTVEDEIVEETEVEVDPEPEKERKSIKQKIAKVVCDALNFRSDIDGEIIRVLFKDDEVKIISENGEWLEVSHNGDTGYVMKQFIK